MPIATLFVILLLFVWITFKVVRCLVLYIEPGITSSVSHLHLWAGKQEYGGARVLARLLARLLDPSRAE